MTTYVYIHFICKCKAETEKECAGRWQEVVERGKRNSTRETKEIKSKNKKPRF